MKEQKFTDFARSQIYALQRWIAGLSTFLIGATFTIMALKDTTLEKAFCNNWFWLVITFTIAHILSTLWYQIWTLYGFYNKLENDKYRDKNRLEWIKKHIWIWETVNIVLFFLGFVWFLVFMFTYLI